MKTILNFKDQKYTLSLYPSLLKSIIDARSRQRNPQFIVTLLLLFFGWVLVALYLYGQIMLTKVIDDMTKLRNY